MRRRLLRWEGVQAGAALQSPRMADTGLFDLAFLRRMADEHARGVRDYSSPLWALLMFEAFLRHNEATA